MEEATKIRLSREHISSLTFQDYFTKPEIEGVFYHPLKKHRSLEGWFMEYLRLTGGQIEGLPVLFEARQISFAHAMPSRINAFHIHPKEIQDELWCVVRGSLKVWLVDMREVSTTEGLKRNYLLDGEAPGLLHIPSGVAHGYKAGSEGALLVYAMNSQFNPEDPNEGRLPWDYFGTDLWDEDRG